MKIANVDFKELTKGVYASEDGKSLVISVYTATGVERSDGVGIVSEAIYKCLRANSDCDIENLIFDCEGFWEHDNKTFSLDALCIRAAFGSLNTIFAGSDIIIENLADASFTRLDAFKIEDIAREARDIGDEERAEYYYCLAATVDAFWGNNYLGEYYEKSERYEEAEACYKKINGLKDKMGDGNASYGYFLDKMGRYGEAMDFFRYVMWQADTSPREGVEVFLRERTQDPDSPYWSYMLDGEFAYRLKDYVAFCETNGKKPDAERILLNLANSDDEITAEYGNTKLIQLYATGKLCFVEFDYIPTFEGYPNYEKLEELVSRTVVDGFAVEDYIIYPLYHNFKSKSALDEAAVKGVEVALSAVECREEFYSNDRGGIISKIILFWLYYSGVYEYSSGEVLELPSLQNRHKAAELFRYADVMNCDYNPQYFDLRELGEFDELFWEAYLLYPKNVILVSSLVERCVVNCEFDKVIRIIDDADAEMAENIASDLLSDWKYYFEYDGSEISCEVIEKILLAFSEKDVLTEFLLSLYQFGKATIDSLYHFKTDVACEVVFAGLENAEKAAAFAAKHGLDLLSEPAVVEY